MQFSSLDIDELIKVVELNSKSTELEKALANKLKEAKTTATAVINAAMALADVVDP